MRLDSNIKSKSLNNNLNHNLNRHHEINYVNKSKARHPRKKPRYPVDQTVRIGTNREPKGGIPILVIFKFYTPLYEKGTK